MKKGITEKSLNTENIEGKMQADTDKKPILTRTAKILTAIVVLVLLIAATLILIGVFKDNDASDETTDGHIVHRYGDWIDRELVTLSKDSIEGDGLRISYLTVEDLKTENEYNLFTVELYDLEPGMNWTPSGQNEEELLEISFKTEDGISCRAAATSSSTKELYYNLWCSFPGGEEELLDLVKVECLEDGIIITAKMPEGMERFEEIVIAAYNISSEIGGFSCFRTYSAEGDSFIISGNTSNGIEPATNTDLAPNGHDKKSSNPEIDTTYLELIGLSLGEIEAKYGEGTYLEEIFCYQFGNNLRCGFSNGMRCITVEAPVKTLLPGISSRGFSKDEIKSIFGTAELGYDDTIYMWWCLSTIYKDAYISMLDVQSDGTVYGDTWYLYNINNYANDAGKARMDKILNSGVPDITNTEV